MSSSVSLTINKTRYFIEIRTSWKYVQGCENDGEMKRKIILIDK